MTNPGQPADVRLPGPFQGRAGRLLQDSTPAWQPQRRPGAGAPNVITILLDDVGFSQLGCYGSSTSTPHMDALATGGIRYDNFHATALCSPTRASLLTGRNHHSVGVGFLADFDTGYPGYRGTVTVEAAMLPELLREQGYGTYAVGKWHLTPPSAMTPAGPFHQWPTGRGFDRYYGFLWGEDDQWAPELWYDQHHVEPPAKPDYHLSEDLADRAREFLSDHVSSAPDRPFYLHLAFGACHAPHQAPAEFIDRYRGKFDHGWDIERQRILDRQIDLGVVPPGTTLPEPNPGVAAWADLSEEQRRLYSRMQEVFAGFMEHTDAQVGRLVSFLADYGLLENTLIVLMADNGASGEGGDDGSANEYRYFLGLDDSFEDSLTQIDQLGGPFAHNHYPSGWAQAGNTPLKMYKKHTFGGGVRVPLIIHWPERFREQEIVRHQFHHVIDIMPTILDVTGTPVPEVLRGVRQMPLHGESMAYTFQEPHAAGRRRTQYFETAGYRGLYHDGYKLVTDHTSGDDFALDEWELYRLDEDFAETKNLAPDNPQLVADLVERWWQEAERYGVLPLDDRMQTRVESRDPSSERRQFRLLPGARLPNGSAGPNIGGRDFRVDARVESFRGDESGVLLSYGRRAAGFSLFLEAGHVVFDFNRAGEHSVVETSLPAPPGTREISIEVAAEGDRVRAVIRLDGVEAAAGSLLSRMPAGLGCLSVQVGHNSPSPVSPRYESPFRYDGTLVEAELELGPPAEIMSREGWNALLAQE